MSKTTRETVMVMLGIPSDQPCDEKRMSAELLVFFMKEPDLFQLFSAITGRMTSNEVTNYLCRLAFPTEPNLDFTAYSDGPGGRL
jgi:hypothetical protein